MTPLYQTRIGDFDISVIETGFSHDVDAMIVGWVYTTQQEANQSRATGIMWDTARILVDVSQPLTAREVDAMRAAGFLVDDTFCP